MAATPCRELARARVPQGPKTITSQHTTARDQRTSDPGRRDASGIRGTPEQVRERLEKLVAAGANHLHLNPISRHAEQLEAAAELAGLK